MSQSTFKLALQIGATIGQSFKSSVKGSQAQLNTLGASIKQLKQQQDAIRKFEIDEANVGKARVEYNHAVKDLSKLRRELHASGPPTKKMARNFQSAQERVNRLSQRLATQRDRLHKTRSALNQTGLSTKNLIRDNDRLGRSVDKLRNKYTKLSSAIKKNEANKAKRAEARGQLFDALAIGATVAAPLSIAIDYEQSIKKLGAITRNSDNNAVMATFDKTARKLGQETQFKSSEVASAMTFLGMAGFDANKITESIPGILDLAMAGDTDLAATSDIASNILSGFSLQADQMGRVGDVLTATFTNSNTNLSMLGETMKFVAPVAASTGASIEDLAAMTGLLGDAGIQGSRAGTALRATFLRLSAPSGQAMNALTELGISVQDEFGNLRPVPVLLQEIADAMEGLGTAQKQAAVKQIFGEEASSGVIKLLEQAKQGELTRFISALGDANGRASEVAKKMAESTHGSLKRLGSALESVAISVGSLLLPMIASGAELFARIASGVTRFAETFPFLTKVVVGAVAGLTAMKVISVASVYTYTFLKGSVLSLVTAYRVVSAAMTLANLGMVRLNILSALTTVRMGIMTAAQWALNVALTANPIGLVVAGIALLAGAAFTVVKYWEPIGHFFSGLWEGIKNVTGKAVKWMLGQIDLLLNPFNLLKKVFGVVTDWIGDDTSSNLIDGQHRSAVSGKPFAAQPVFARLDSPPDISKKIQSVQSPQRVSQHTHIDAPITIHAAPGMDERTLANEVHRQLEQREVRALSERRAVLYDQ